MTGQFLWRPSRRTLALGLGATLSAGCTAQAQPDSALIAMRGVTFPLQRAAGKRYVEDAAGKPFFMNGDTAWSLVAGLNREDADVYLRDRAARGVNAVMTYVLCKYHARRAPANVFGDLPFTRMVDFTRPNEAYFAHLDWVVARAAELGLLMILSPCWLGAKGVHGGFYQEMRAAGPDAMRRYGLFLGRRYAGATNILWLLGGDFSPPEKLLVRAMAEGIRDGGSTGLRTAHCAPYDSPLDVWAGEAWLDLNNLYSYGSLWEIALRERARPERMPCFMSESVYENEPGAGQSALRIRRQAYEAVLGGAFGHVLGSSPIWHMDAPGTGGRMIPDWRARLDSPGARGMKVLTDLFTGVAWWKLEPDTGARLLADPGGGEDKAVAAIDRERRFAICYLPQTAPVAVRLSALAEASRVGATWCNPADGAALPAQASAPVGDLVTYTPPARGGAGDWTLVFTTRA